MDRVCIIGASSLISKEFIKMLKCDYTTIGRTRSNVIIDINVNNFKNVSDIPINYNKYVITLGHLIPKKITQQTYDETLYSISINLLSIVHIVEHIMSKNPNARIAILGSESGKKGSYDTTYFLCKAALRQYVKERKLSFAGQQLVLISPSLIEDTNMFFQLNADKAATSARTNPKNRLLNAKEIANAIYFLLFEDNGYITNTEIEINGGKFARCAN